MTANLRGAFDPKIQVVIGAVMIALASLTLRVLRPADWAALDLRVAPFALLLGLAVGLPIGISRFRILKQVLPEVEGQFHLSQRPVLSRLRQGANLLYLQRLSYGGAVLLWFMLTTYTHGKVLLYGSMATFVLGSYLAGQTVPFIRLWFYLSRAQRSQDR